MAQPCVFVGMGGTGMSLVSNLYAKVSKSRAQRALIGERYFFALFDTEPRPATLPTQIEYFQVFGKPAADLPAVRDTIKGFNEFFPPAPYEPATSRFPGAAQEPNFTFFALCNTMRVGHGVGLATFLENTSGTLLKLDPNSDFARNDTGQAYLPIVYLAGCCGGTGAGLALHLPFLLRDLFGKRLGEKNVTTVNIGLFNSPEATSTFKSLNDSMKANAYATALTLDNWQAQVRGSKFSPGWQYEMDYGFEFNNGNMRAVVQSEDRPYDMVYWVGDRIDGGQEMSSRQISDASTDFLYSAFCGTNTSGRYKSHMSNVIRRCEEPITDISGNVARPQSYGSFCVARLQFPRSNILKYCGDFVASRWRREFVDIHDDAIDADIAGVVKSIAEKFNIEEGSIRKIWRSSNARQGSDLSVDLSRPKDKLREIKRCTSSHTLGTQITACLDELKDVFEDSLAQFKRDQTVETTADRLVEQLTSEFVECLKGNEERYRKLIAGRQISFFYASAKAFDNYLGNLVGEAQDGVMTGLHGKAAELRIRIESEIRVLNDLGSANKRKGLFLNPVKDDADKAWSTLERLARYYTDSAATEVTIEALTFVRARLRSALTDSISLFKNMLNRHFVEKHENVESMPLPPLQSSDSVKSAIILPVLYDRDLIHQRWLVGWKEAKGAKPANDPKRTVLERLKEDIGDPLIKVSGSGSKGPLMQAIQTILKETVTQIDADLADIENKSIEHFKGARELLEHQIAGEVKNLSVWEAFWEEVGLRAKRDKMRKEDVAVQMLRGFSSQVAPLWTRQDIGALQNSAADQDVHTMLIGPSFDSVNETPLKRLVVATLLGGKEQDCHEAGVAGAGQQNQHITKWSDFALVVRTMHGYPVSRLFAFETQCRSLYERQEASVPGSVGGRYMHTDYKYRNAYKPLDFEGTDTQNLDRELVVLCEYISETSPEFFSERVPRIDKKGAANYEVVTRRDSTKVKGREALYTLFSQRSDLRDEIRGCVEAWWEHAGSKTQKKALLDGIRKWADKRAQTVKGALKDDFAKDAEVIEELVKRTA